jgi:hypothetical protein
MVADHHEDECTTAEGVDTVPKRKRWGTPLVIVSAAHGTQAHVTVFTDGTDLGAPYGS